jgi:hypothetical protein
MIVCDLDISQLRELRSDEETYFTNRKPDIYTESLSQTNFPKGDPPTQK